MKTCNVCDQQLGAPIFRAESETAMTSLCEARPGQVIVWSCDRCGHLCGDALDDTGAYYEQEYRILLNHEEEDQIYEVVGEQITYRTEHQVDTLLGKLPLSTGALILDYGCAKASTPKLLLSRRPDLQVHLFDVSEMYRGYWEKFTALERQAVHTTPAEWEGHFDAVTSYFALEHIPVPGDTVRHIASLLKDGGLFYCIVPDVFGNIADFVVIDHVNHFTASSVTVLLENAGFSEISVDSEAHRGAHVVVARKGRGPAPVLDIAATTRRSSEIAAYWAGMAQRIQRMEKEYPSEAVAIYGSGFYGAYIATTLVHPERVRCFLDRSPFQQGRKLFGKEIIAPANVPANTEVIYVGLNPAIARNSISLADFPNLEDINLIYLDSVAECD